MMGFGSESYQGYMGGGSGSGSSNYAPPGGYSGSTGGYQGIAGDSGNNVMLKTGST